MKPEEFQKYESYRTPLSQAEQATLDATADPVAKVQFAQRVALEQANRSLAHTNHPESFKECMICPNVSPMGKATGQEIVFQERYTRLQNSAAFQRGFDNPQNKKVLSLVWDLGHENTPLSHYRTDMEAASVEARTELRAAKLCHDKVGADRLEASAKERMTTSKAAQEYDHILSAAEYMAGLRTTPLSPACRTFCEQTLSIPHDTLQPGVPQVSESNEISVPFSNFEDLVQVAAATAPTNWGKSSRDMPRDFKDGPAGQQVMDAYAVATAKQTLAPLFAGKETEQLGRESLMMIGGRPVREILLDEYKTNHPDAMSAGNFNKYLKEQGPKRTNELTAAALMSGQRVEAFVPDAQGKLPAEPVTLTHQGYTPTPLTPVVLGKWDRFVQKLGIKREKFAKAAEYAQEMEGRAQLKESYLSSGGGSMLTGIHNEGNPLHESFVQSVTGEMGSDVAKWKLSPGFRTGRMGPYSACAAQLLVEGHSLEDICSPDKLMAEKATAMQEYVNRGKAGDGEWLSTTYIKGMECLSKQTMEMAQNGAFSDWNKLQGNMALGTAIAHISKDMSQECEQFINITMLNNPPSDMARANPGKQEAVAMYDKTVALTSQIPNPHAGTDHPWANLSNSEYVRQTINSTQTLSNFLNTTNQALSAQQEMQDGLCPDLQHSLRNAHTVMGLHRMMGEMKQNPTEFLLDSSKGMTMIGNSQQLWVNSANMDSRKDVVEPRIKDAKTGKAMEKAGQEMLAKTCTMENLTKEGVSYQSITAIHAYPVGKQGKSFFEEKMPSLFGGETAKHAEMIAKEKAFQAGAAKRQARADAARNRNANLKSVK